MRRASLSLFFALAACRKDAADPIDVTADTHASDTASVVDDTVQDTRATDTAPAATDTVPDASDTVEDSADTADTADSADTHDAEVARKNTCTAPASAAVEGAGLPEGFCASVWASDLATPRGLFVTEDGDVLVVERSASQVTALWDADGDGVSGAGERVRLARASGLNHGVAVHGGFLYASSASTVYRWAFAAGTRADLGAPEVVVRDIPTGGHATRTVVLDASGRLYVSVGSASNVDADARRARVRRFDVVGLAAGGIPFTDGEIFADGLRNEVGLAFDAAGRLWGVQNGIDMLQRADLGGDIHEDNPAEILSRFDTSGAFHGYPWCWTEFRLPEGVGLGAGTMWAHPSTMNDGTHDDAWCRDPAHVDPPELAMQAHAAPLDLEFYGGASFPATYAGDLFITLHGSWNRSVPTGYKVVHVDIDASGRASAPEPFLEYAGQGDLAARWPHRPVGVRVGRDGQLFVSSDASNVIIVVGYRGQ